MGSYTVSTTGYADYAVTVEAADVEEAKDKVLDDGPTLCAQCAGWGRKYNLELGEEWNVVAVYQGDEEVETAPTEMERLRERVRALEGELAKRA